MVLSTNNPPNAGNQGTKISKLLLSPIGTEYLDSTWSTGTS